MTLKSIEFEHMRSDLRVNLEGLSLASTHDSNKYNPVGAHGKWHTYDVSIYGDLDGIINDYIMEPNTVGALFRTEEERLLSIECHDIALEIYHAVEKPSAEGGGARCLAHPKWPLLEQKCAETLALLQENDRQYALLHPDEA